MVIGFGDGETLRGKEAEKFSFFEDALKLVLQAYANGAFTACDLKKELDLAYGFLCDVREKKEILRRELISIEQAKKCERLS